MGCLNLERTCVHLSHHHVCAYLALYTFSNCCPSPTYSTIRAEEIHSEIVTSQHWKILGPKSRPLDPTGLLIWALRSRLVLLPTFLTAIEGRPYSATHSRSCSLLPLPSQSCMITRHATRQALPTKLFHFRGCLHASKRAASTSVIHTIPASQDDKLLVALLDQPKSRSRLTFTSRTGIFGHPTLTHPQALVALANSTLVRAQLLTERILRARESRDELVKVVKNLDRLSDLLCGVIDLSEFIQSSHPERIWVEAANTAYETLCEYINVLNTHKGLYDVRYNTYCIPTIWTDMYVVQVLKAVFDDKSIMDSLSPEALRTALIFWRDFEKSAISQPEHRDRYVQLSSEVLVLGRQFLQQASAPRQPALIKPSELVGLKDQGMGVRLRQQARFTNKDLHVYPGSLQAQMIMRSAPLEEPRRKLYMAQNSSPKEHVETLDLLLRKRAEMAQLVGRESYADLALVDTMAKSSRELPCCLYHVQH